MTKAVPTARMVGALALSLAGLFASSSAFAGWQEDASPAEIDRINQLPQIRDAAIADSQHGESRGDPRAIVAWAAQSCGIHCGRRVTARVAMIGFSLPKVPRTPLTLDAETIAELRAAR